MLGGAPPLNWSHAAEPVGFPFKFENLYIQPPECAYSCLTKVGDQGVASRTAV